MARLVSFGCSYTVGVSLPDNHHLAPYPGIPSIYAWPKVLADLLNVPCENLAVGGSGNLEILWKILNTKFLPGDVVCIAWSHFSRDMLFDEKLGKQRINENTSYLNTTLSKRWLMVHSDYDFTMRNWLYIHHAHIHLKNLGIETYHAFGAHDIDVQIKPDCLNIDNITNTYFLDLDKGADNSHPGVQSNKLFAENIHKYITTARQAGP
jgi:hypothetical protein